MTSWSPAERETAAQVFVDAKLPALRALSTDHPTVPVLAPELAALAATGFAPGPLLAAQREAVRAGVAPFDALAAIAGLGEDELVLMLARGIGVDALGPDDFEGPGIDADACAMALRTGAVRLRDRRGRPRLFIAARGSHVGRLALVTRKRRGRRSDFVLAGTRAFADLVVARAGSALAARACEGPSLLFPKLTVAGGLPEIGAFWRWTTIVAVVAGAVSTFLFEAAGSAALALSSLMFAALNSFRLWVACTPETDLPPPGRGQDRDLPIYTVLVALAKEAAVVPGLLDALERLDYPAAKLDIKLLVEADDRNTLGALDRRPPRPGIEVLKLPPGGPKTKPRALNAGLLAARGQYLAVFDAEDQPDPSQLRFALDAFRRGPRTLACVQARLAIDNLADGWLARQFAIEYAALFDVVLPALASLGLPIALGGTSNHFRTATLRSVGGWDAGNVTEDADLGLRLARLGWTTRTIASTTWEEAPTRVWPWLKQRTRWMKGFMVTTIVHGRGVRGLAAKLDPLALGAALMLVGGVALTALAYPVVMLAILWRAVDGSLLAPATGLADATFAGFCVASLIVGYSTGLACGWMGVERRGPATLSADLFTLPFYWLLVGAAAWRALYQIARGQTSHWEKTMHGVSTRRAAPPRT
ncbi:MAG TPA: glycosyltransferase [Hansschlegelia sp.]